MFQRREFPHPHEPGTKALTNCYCFNLIHVSFGVFMYMEHSPYTFILPTHTIILKARETDTQIMTPYKL